MSLFVPYKLWILTKKTYNGIKCIKTSQVLKKKRTAIVYFCIHFSVGNKTYIMKNYML